MPDVAKRLERLEAATPLVGMTDAEKEAAARRLMEMLARYAETYHRDDLTRAAQGLPPRVDDGASPAQQLVRAAMTEAAKAGAWGSAEYAAQFWHTSLTSLMEHVRTRLRGQSCA